MSSDRRARWFEHARVVCLHRWAEEGQLLQSGGYEHRTGQALERCRGGDLHRWMVITQQPQHATDVALRRRHREEARALEPLPPARRSTVGAYHPGPPLVLEGVGQLWPPLACHARPPVDARVDRE